jgi:Family of unknown function (DUF6675)
LRCRLLIVAWFGAGLLVAQQLPCAGAATSPAYPAAGAHPVVQAWDRSNWTPPPCAHWQPADSATLVATAARFRNSADLRRRIGAISKMKGLLYWSTSDKRWQTLIVDASALDGPEGARRADFTAEEFTAGRDLWAEEEDNLLGKAVYRIRVLEAGDNRLVFATENQTAIRFFGLPVFSPGELQSICFLDRESKDVWRYYSLARLGKQVSLLLSGHEASLVNRAVASYRFLAGIPADQEPPAAR